jgi:DNA replication protein DnaC
MQTIDSVEIYSDKKLTPQEFKDKYGHLFDYWDDVNGYCVKCIMRKAFKTDVCMSDKVGMIANHKCIQVSSEYYDQLYEEKCEGENNAVFKFNKYDDFECGNTNEIINHVASRKQIYLWGEYGRGKSHFLKYLQRKQGGLLILVAEMHSKMLEEINQQKSGYVQKSIKNQMLDTPYLYLDDLGNENMSDFVQETLQIVINTRYEKKMPTYITSNYSLEELYHNWTKKIGKGKAGQLASRIETFGVIEIKGINYRKGV